MKILPITTNNNYNKPVVSKGGVSAQIQTMMRDMVNSCRDNAQYHRFFNQDVASNYQKYSQTADNVLFNLNQLMLQYPVNSVLRMAQSVKYPQKLRFYISSIKSHYHRILGDVYIDKNDVKGNIKRMTEFTDKFANENPFETNLKFRMNAKKGQDGADYFLPEKEIIIIEDELKEYNI